MAIQKEEYDIAAQKRMSVRVCNAYEHEEHHCVLHALLIRLRIIPTCITQCVSDDTKGASLITLMSINQS